MSRRTTPNLTIQALIVMASTHAWAADIAREAEALKQEYQAVLAARDELERAMSDRVKRDTTKEPARDFVFKLEHATNSAAADLGRTSAVRKPVSVELCRRGGKWFPRPSPAVNRSEYRIDAGGLTLADQTLTGAITVTWRPNRVVSPDGKPRGATYRLKVAIEGDRLKGTFTGDGDYGSQQGTVAGSVVSVPTGAAVEFTNRGEESKLPADPAAAACKMAALATTAYQQARAAALSLRHYPFPFADALDLTSMPVPEWGVTKASLGAEAEHALLTAGPKRDMGTAQNIGAARGIVTKDAEEDPDSAPILDLGTRIAPVRRSVPKEVKPLSARDIASIREYVGRLRSLLENPLRRIGESEEFTLGSEEVDDLMFGPYFDDAPMDADAEGLAQLPADAGPDGPQDWRFIPRWRTIAAFTPDRRPDLDAPLLPEIVPALDAGYVPDADELGANYEVPKDGLCRWAQTDVVWRFVAPPYHKFRTGPPPPRDKDELPQPKTVGVHGLTSARWYGTAEVYSPKDVELFASAEAARDGKLWVNDRLVWVTDQQVQGASAPRGTGAIEGWHPTLFRVKFTKGINRLLFACQCRGKASYFSLMVCTRGRPMTAEARTATRKAQLKAIQGMPADSRRGRRGDWSSRFPDADPPVWWDVQERVNVVWRTPLPDYSAANPVIAGDKVLVNCEPHTLYCLDKNTGKILWRQESHIFDLLPENERVAAMKAWEQGQAVEKSPEKNELTGELAALEREIKDLKESGQGTDAKIKELEGKITPVKEKLDALGQKQGAYMQWYGRLGVMGPGWMNNYGWTYSAPVTDGKHVWVKYGTGVAACYDLDGNRKWLVRTGMSGSAAQLASPLLLEGNMILKGQFSDPALQTELSNKSLDSLDHFTRTLMALDAATGKQVWARPIPAMAGYGDPSGIVPMRVSNGSRTREIVVTASGLLVDPKDGRLLCSCLGLGPTCWYEDPIVVDNRIYWYRGGAVKAAEVWIEDNGRVGAKYIMCSEHGSGSAAASYANGYIVWNYGDPGSRHPIPWHTFGQCDATTGKRMPEIKTALDQGGLSYTPAASAGPYAVITGTGPGPHAWSIDLGSSAQMGFVKPGPKPYIVNTCKLGEPMVAQPVFEGNRMYVRTYLSAMCIGATTDEGRVKMLRKKAAYAFASIPKQPLQFGLMEIKPDEQFTPQEGVPIEPCDVQTAPRKWLFAGPFPNEKDADLLQALGGESKARPVPGKDFTYKDKPYRFVPLADNFVETIKGGSVDSGTQQVSSATCRIDLSGPIDRQTNSVAYFYSVIQNGQERILVADLQGFEECSVWISGRRIRKGSTFKTKPGYYPIMVRFEIAAVAPAGKTARAEIRFREAEGLAKWKEQIADQRERLEEIVRDLPGSDEAKAAAAMLSSLGGKP